MKYFHVIPVVNRPDLLELAVRAVEPLWPDSIILDNSDDGRIGRDRPWPIQVVRPSVPLSVAQTMNFSFRLARERGAAVFGFQHNDAEPAPGAAAHFRELLAELTPGPRRWAAALTQYDILSAYRVTAVEDVGEWDTSFPQPNYHIDNDWFYRAKLKGYELVETGLAVTHHGGCSSTIKSSPRRALLNSVTFPMNEEYYRRKWGGAPGAERLRAAWDGQMPAE